MVWEDDALGFSSAGATGSRYYQFIANAAAQWDSAVRTAPGTPRGKRPGRQLQAMTGRLKWRSLRGDGRPPKDGSQWGFNVAWDRQTPSPFIASWAVVQSLHEPQNFGRMLMTSITPAGSGGQGERRRRRGEVTFAARVIAGLQPVALRMTSARLTICAEVAAGLVEAGHETMAGPGCLALERWTAGRARRFPGGHYCDSRGNEVYRTVIPMA